MMRFMKCVNRKMMTRRIRSFIPIQGNNLLDVSVEDAKTALIIMMQSHDIHENREQELQVVENQESSVTISFETHGELTPIGQEGEFLYRTSVIDDDFNLLSDLRERIIDLIDWMIDFPSEIPRKHLNERL
jgi:hypothetical protein